MIRLVWVPLAAASWAVIIAVTGVWGVLALVLALVVIAAYAGLLVLVTARDQRRRQRRRSLAFPDPGGHVRRRWTTSTR